MARNVSPQDWAALTVGQSLGLLGAIVVGLGWPVVGAAVVAQADPEGRRRIYADALTSRVAAAVVVTPIAAGLAVVVAPGDGHALTCALMAVATTLSGLSIAWFCVGSAAPREIAAFEIAPRVSGLVLGGLAVAASGKASFYPAVIAVSTISGLGAYSRRVLGPSPVRALVSTHPVWTLRTHGKLALIETSAASFTSGLGFLSGFFLSVPELARLGSGERLSQVLLPSIAALSNTVHPWLAVAPQDEFRRRALRVGALHVAAGVLLLLALGLAGPLASKLLFGPGLQAPAPVCWTLGAYLLFVNLQTVACRHILVTQRQTGHAVRANVLAALIAVPLVLVGAKVAGSVGAVSGMATGELLIFLFALPAALRCVRLLRRWSA
ncbi:hypothetical protein [Terrabacter sp. BE26]|uniref:hypothetical protein n=1 Tax=Terrabacter sp. BE26 TaxID=2898152 RepID=UPI0035BE4BE9